MYLSKCLSMWLSQLPQPLPLATLHGTLCEKPAPQIPIKYFPSHHKPLFFSFILAFPGIKNATIYIHLYGHLLRSRENSPCLSSLPLWLKPFSLCKILANLFCLQLITHFLYLGDKNCTQYSVRSHQLVQLQHAISTHVMQCFTGCNASLKANMPCNCLPVSPLSRTMYLYP